jgi:hypothetical protein
MSGDLPLRLPPRREIRIDTHQGIIYEGDVLSFRRTNDDLLDDGGGDQYALDFRCTRILLDRRFEGYQVAMFQDAMKTMNPDVIVLQEAP